MLSCGVYLSVCLSICLSRAWTLSKQINVSSNFFTVNYPHHSSFSVPNVTAIFRLGMLIFEKFFSSPVFEFRRSPWSLGGISAVQYIYTDSKKKITVGVAWSWLVHTDVSSSSNIFVSSTHSVGEWLKCRVKCLDKRAIHIDGRLLSFGLRHNTGLPMMGGY